MNIDEGAKARLHLITSNGLLAKFNSFFCLVARILLAYLWNILTHAMLEISFSTLAVFQ